MSKSQQFLDVAIKSLDNDLADLLRHGRAGIEDLMQLQMLRLMRGRPHEVVETPMQGWTPDGKTWYPSEPGTFPKGTK